jgi:hypothetical protein
MNVQEVADVLLGFFIGFVGGILFTLFYVGII